MLICSVAVCAAAFVAAVTMARPIQALTMQECSIKYKAAQAAGTLKGTKWNDFRKAECGPDASSATPTTAPTNTRPCRCSHLTHNGSSAEDGTSGRRRCSVPHRGVTEILQRVPQVRRACTPALINTMPTRRIMPTAASSGSKKAAAITASATGTLRAEAIKNLAGRTEFTGGIDV